MTVVLDHEFLVGAVALDAGEIIIVVVPSNRCDPDCAIVREESERITSRRHAGCIDPWRDLTSGALIRPVDTVLEGLDVTTVGLFFRR